MHTRNAEFRYAGLSGKELRVSVETFSCRCGLLILVLNVNPDLLLLDRVNVSDAANVSEANAAPILMVEVYVIQFNSLLFTCRANSYKANYRHSTAYI
jgi:hypothetical protein